MALELGDTVFEGGTGLYYGRLVLGPGEDFHGSEEKVESGLGGESLGRLEGTQIVGGKTDERFVG